jgi:2-polyprenyl-3-methyl-5-hydroxy-6-metoxy-1,4-benzoquinol methylase
MAPTFDNEPDHGLRDPLIREAWVDLLKAWLPEAKSAILDIGCGTGSLSVLLAGLGHAVTGIDLSSAMISQAQKKAAALGYAIKFNIMDAAFPRFPRQQFDILVCRHLLWALPEPAQVLQRWVELLKPEGRLFLVEGYWNTGAGLHAQEVAEMLPPACASITILNLSYNPNYWGGKVADERYAIIGDLSS